MAKEKKVNIKDIKKKEVIQAIQELFEDRGFEVNNGTDYGLTSSTLVVNFIECVPSEISFCKTVKCFPCSTVPNFLESK